MNFLRSLHSALSGPNRGTKRHKADIADASTRNYFERDDVVEEVVDQGQEEGHNDQQKHLSSVTGAFLMPRTRSPSPSRSPSDTGSYQPSTVPPSEYNLLAAPKSTKWNAPTTFTLRHRRTCWITTFAITMVSLTAILATVLTLTHHAHKAVADINLTVDLGYSKYTGISAADNKIASWLGIRYAAPPVGNNRFRAPQPPLVNSSVQLANKVCLIFSFGIS